MGRVRAGAVALIAVVLAGCAASTPVDRAQALVRMHRENEAVAMLATHLRKHPDDLPARRLYVRVLAYTGDIDGARREVTTLEERLPNDPVPYIELGHAFELGHRFDEALAAYDSAASVAPASPVGPREGGMRAARWGEHEEAEPRLVEAIRRGARDAETYHALGLVRLHGRDLDGANEAYRKGLAADPRSLENLLGLASVAVTRGDPAEALRAYDALLAQKPDHAAAELGRAWSLAKLGRAPEASRAVDRAAELGAPAANVTKLREAIRTGALLPSR